MHGEVSPMVIRDVADGGFAWANRAFAERAGWGVDDLEASPLVAWIDTRDQETFRELLEGGGGTIRARHRSKTGEPVPMDWEIRREEHGLVALGVLAHRASKPPVPRAEDAGRGLPGNLIDDTLAETLKAMALIIEDQHPGRLCSILLLDPEGRRVSVGAGPSLPDRYNAAVEGLHIGPFVGSCGTAAYWNQPVVVEDIRAEGLWRDLRDAADLAGVAACWSHPIVSQSGAVLGALALYNIEPSAPTAHEFGGLKMASSMVALAIERGRVEQALRASEAALRESEDRYRTLYEDNPSMYFTVDPAGTVLSVNKYGAQCLGYGVSELVGESVTQVFHPEDRESARARLKQTLDGAGAVAGWELRKVRKDGSVLWVEESARAIRDKNGEIVVLVVCEDVTLRKQANSLVELQSAVLASMASGAELPVTLALLCTLIEEQLQGVRCMVLLLDESGDTIRPTAGPSMPSEILAALDGITAETSIGTCAAAVFQERQLIVDDVEQEPAWAQTLPLARRHGVRASWSTPLRSRSGSVLGALSICSAAPSQPTEHDQRLMQTAAHLAGIATGRLRQEEALRRTQKLESLGLMAGSISHDFNNLLVAMLGQSSLALAKVRARDPARVHIEKVVGAAERATDLTNQLLAYSGRGHFEFRRFDLNEAIRESLHLFDVAIPKAVRIETDLSPSLPPVEADTGQMQQVFMNLVMNAAESIHKDAGQVTIRTKIKELVPGDPRYGQYTNEALAGGSYVALEVQDDGAGMDPGAMSRIFDPFFTTKPTGHGLGLAAVLGIVRGHRGGLSVASELGSGTTFSLVFPAGDAGMPATPAEVTTPPSVAVAGQVLVIDDEEAVRDAVTDFLTYAGMHVLRASGGAEGLTLYGKHGAEIDLVVLDLSMPEMSGEETLERLRALNPDVRVLLSSGYDESEVARRFTGKRLAGFIQKPYRPNELIAKVGALLAPLYRGETPGESESGREALE